MTSIDTNVLIDLLQADTTASQIASAALTKASAAGPLCICGAVFSELLGFPGRTVEELIELFNDLKIVIEWDVKKPDWQDAGVAFQSYVHRRRANGVSYPRRILTDFLIGAHASVRGYTLLTQDKRIYAASFPGLRIQSA